MTGPVNLDRLASRLADACGGLDHHERVVVSLSATATGMALFGAGLGDPWWEGMAEHPRPARIVRTGIEHLFDDEHLAAALAFEPTPRADTALRSIGAVLVSVGGQRAIADTDLHGPSDVLGGLYSLLRGSGSRSARGAFFTPMSVARLMAAMNLPEPGTAVTDPCCGSGALLLATVREIRNAGRDPREVRFVGNDLDPLAAALAHLNLTFAGVEPTITVGDALAQAG